MGISKIRYSALFLAFLILISAVCLPVNAASATVQNIAVTKFIDEPYHKKTLFVITTDQITYHIIVEANITTAGNETLIQLIATLYNPQNETITASAQIPDTLTDAPYYIGSVDAFHLHLDPWVVTALRIALPIVMVVALVLQIIDIIEDFVEHPVLETLKTLLFGGPFIYASLPWVMLTLLQDTNSDGSFDMYVPWWPPSPHINLILQKCYFIATSLNWWRIKEQEVYTDIPIPFDGVWHIVWFTYFVAQWWSSRQQSIPLPPTAEFVWRPNQPVVNENVSFTSTSFAPNGTITTYQWWLGDGNQETDLNFTYVYHSADNYNVTLKVTDNNGLTGNVTHTVIVQPPSDAPALRVIPDHLQVSVQMGQNATAQFLVGETLNQSDLLGVNFKAFDLSKTFENQTISSGNVTFNRNGINVTKGTYTNVTATFHAPSDSSLGWYSGNITATSTNGGNSTIFAELFVYGPPVANFTWNPLTPKVGEVVTFDASSSIPSGGSIVDYEWNFGDGQTAFGQTAEHTYADATIYTVTLNVTDSNGLWNTTQEQVHVLRDDVAIEDVVPDSDWVYRGSLCHAGVNVTVGNLGEVSENFTVTLYAFNDTATPANLTVGTQQVMDLLPNGTLVLRFIWNSSDAQPCHWYNMTAVASTVQGETNTENNVNSSLILVKVRLFADVNGDGKVDIKDVALAAKAFGESKGDPRWLPWGPYADMDSNGKIDIKDISLIAKNFGKTC